MTTSSIASNEIPTPVPPVTPIVIVPYTLQWSPDRATTATVGRFVQLALTVDVPAGWVTQRDRLHHREA
jgi:hypothetical protein